MTFSNANRDWILVVINVSMLEELYISVNHIHLWSIITPYLAVWSQLYNRFDSHKWIYFSRADYLTDNDEFSMCFFGPMLLPKVTLRYSKLNLKQVVHFIPSIIVRSSFFPNLCSAFWRYAFHFSFIIVLLRIKKFARREV